MSFTIGDEDCFDDKHDNTVSETSRLDMRTRVAPRAVAESHTATSTTSSTSAHKTLEFKQVPLQKKAVQRADDVVLSDDELKQVRLAAAESLRHVLRAITSKSSVQDMNAREAADTVLSVLRVPNLPPAVPDASLRTDVWLHVLQIEPRIMQVYFNNEDVAFVSSGTFYAVESIMR